jgi:hypothetical protein
MTVPLLHTHFTFDSMARNKSFRLVKVKMILRLTVCRPVRPGVRHPSGTRDQFFFPLEIFFRHLQVCYFAVPSLTRGRICNLLYLLGLASAVPLGSESHGTQDHILLSQFFRLPQPGGPGPCIYIPQEQSVPVIPAGTGFPFHHFLRLAGLQWSYSNTPPQGLGRPLIFSPNLKGQVPVFISPRNRVAQLYPGTLGLSN